MDKFVNLHVHSDASLGDSVIKIPDLVNKVEEYGQEYIALTDHGSTMNHYSLLKECEGRNVKPILGNEVYCKTTLDKPNNRNRYHLVLLAQNEKGLQNIRKLQRISVKDHMYYKPLVPHELLFENSEGIFVSTACSLSYINQNFTDGNDDEAYNFINKLLDNFGKENVSIELQYHNDFEIDGEKVQNFLNQKLIEMYDNTDVKYIINTFDSHVLTDEDRILRKKIQSISWKKLENEINDTLKTNILGNSTFCYDFAKESGIDDKDFVKKCIDNTHKIAEKVYFEPKKYDKIVPDFTFHRHFKEIFCKKIY